MLRFRCFRNDDPSALVALWNEVFTGRGAYQLHSAGPLERHILSKLYFDPAGLIIAEDGGEVMGFVHAGFGPNDDESALDHRKGLICAIAVRAAFRRHGLGTQLLQRAETYLMARGAVSVQAGTCYPHAPFYFGLYGGSDVPGFLLSDAAAAPFFEGKGYLVSSTLLVFQRRIDQLLAVADARFAAVRRKYDVRLMPRNTLGTWWQESMLGMIEPVEFRLEDKLSSMPAARALVWEMEGFSARWNLPAVGVLELIVRQDVRRQGLAKFLLTQLMRNLQDQFFGIVEAHVPATDEPALALLRSLGFAQVDVGRVWTKTMQETG